jgi:LuxR family transcriptional regulator, maltose regulon positive regulatory protein
MAQELGCSAEAPAFLEYMYRERLFTERRGQVYRYHDLFRSFLLDRLRRRCSSEDLCVLQRRAARILREAGQVEAAFRLDCETHDWAAAHGLVRQHAPALLDQGRSSVLREWIDRLPKSLVDADPWIGYWFGMSWLEVDADRARTHLRHAFETMRAHDADGRMLAASAFILTFLNDLANLKELDPWIDVLVAMFEKPIGPGSPIAQAQACAALVFALSHRRPERERLETFEERTLAALSADLPAIVRLGTCGWVAGAASATAPRIRTSRGTEPRALRRPSSRLPWAPSHPM